MPRNRRPQDREQKRAEIVAAAEALFTGDGYEQASMTRIAAAAGVTPTTIYWYFRDKDELLVAVLDHLLAEVLRQPDGVAALSLTDQVLLVLARLEAVRPLVTLVHARTPLSDGVAAWHSSFHALVETMLADGLRSAGTPEGDVGALTRVGVLVVEGLLTHPLGEADRRAAVALVTART